MKLRDLKASIKHTGCLVFIVKGQDVSRFTDFLNRILQSSISIARNRNTHENFGRAASERVRTVEEVESCVSTAPKSSSSGRLPRRTTLACTWWFPLELPVRQRLPSLPSTESELEQHSQLTSAALHGREWRRPLGGELKINTLT